MSGTDPGGKGTLVMITSIVLNQLVCAAESNGGSHPYLWAELLQIDNRTIDSGALVASIGCEPATRLRFRRRRHDWPHNSIRPSRSRT
jgi:hypothetical protein